MAEAAAIVSAVLGIAQYHEGRQEASRMRSMQRQAEEREENYLTGKYESDVENFEQTMNLIDRYIGYWSDLEADPRAHPQFDAFKRAVYEEGDIRRAESEDALRRRGITGGRQEEIFQDIETDIQNTINETLLGIQRTAKEKQFELEQMRPGEPYKGMPTYQGSLTMAQGYSAYPQLPNIDLSGLGEALAYFEKSIEGKGTTSTTQAQGSTGTSLALPDLDLGVDIDELLTAGRVPKLGQGEDPVFMY